MYPIKPQENPHLYTIKEVAEILRIGVGRAYELAREKTFPVVKIGSRVRIPKNRFHEWLDKQCEIA
jgi:excisionase family DNA binding protein